MKRFLSLLALLTLVFFALPGNAHADTNDFTVDDFTGTYTLSRDDPQGALGVQERIHVTFTDSNHGIFRAIPKGYNGHPLHLHVTGVFRDGNREPYSTYTSNGNDVLKIGSASSTITGSHEYDINYRVVNVMRFPADHDELDWNINGTEWKQPFTRITAHFVVPADLAAKLKNGGCYTGQLGSLAHDCFVSSAGNTTTITTSRTLLPGENLTYSADFPLGSFTKPGLRDWWADNGLHAAVLVGLPLIAFIAAFRYWSKNGKDLKGRGTIIPEYGPPDNLRPAEVDVINHYQLGQNAISATIIDLAIRKYLKIIEGQSNGLMGLGKHKTYTLQRLPAPASDNLKPYEQIIYDGLFPSGDTTDIKDLQNKFYVTAGLVKAAIPAALASEGYVPKNVTSAGTVLSVAALLCVLVAFFLHSFLSLGLVVSAVILIFFGVLMPRRLQKGVDAKDAIAGLKMYMETAEKDRIAMLQSPDAPYAPKSAEPTKTVDLYEKLLPYAMVLGVEKQWSTQFAGIYTSPPDWYAGNWSTFNALYLADSISSSMNAMNASFAAPSSSGSGSGGGFSGGGGGGGGGGW